MYSVRCRETGDICIKSNLLGNAIAIPHGNVSIKCTSDFIGTHSITKSFMLKCFHHFNFHQTTKYAVYLFAVIIAITAVTAAAVAAAPARLYCI